MMISNLSILCSTCLKYQDLWQNQINALDKFWPNHPQLLFVSDKDENVESKDGFFFVNGNFSDRLKKALLELESEYVLVTLDDYLLAKDIDEKKISEILSYMKTNNVSYAKVHKARYGTIINRNPKIKKLSLAQPYEVSLLPGIWKREDLIKILPSDKSPWQVEVMLSKLCKENNYFCVCFCEKDNYCYVDLIRKGKYLTKGYNYLKKNNYYVSERPRISLLSEMKLNFIEFVNLLIPYKLKKKLIKIFHYKSYASGTK